MKNWLVIPCLTGIGLLAIAASVAAKGDIVPTQAAAKAEVSPTSAPAQAKEAAAPENGDATDSEAADEEAARRALKVAEVGDRTITLGDMEDALASQPPMFRQEFASKEKQKELLDSLIQTVLLAEEAERRGFDKDPEVAAVAKNKMASLMHRKLVESADKITPSDEDLKKYYDAHLSDYHKPEKMRARHILMKDKAAAEAKLKELLGKKVELYEFRKIAKELTEDEATKKNGGDLGFFTKVSDRKEGDPEVPAPLVEAAFTLKKNGEIYPKLIETDAGYHILMRTGYRSKLDVSFEDAKERLAVLVQRDLRREAVEAGIEKLKTKFPVEVLEENLKHVVIDLSEDSAGGSRSAAPGAR